MKTKEKILIAGGDLRQLYCAEKLSQKYETAVIGFDKKYIPSSLSVKIAETDETGLYDYAVLPVVPLDNDGSSVAAPCSSSQLKAVSVADMIKQDGMIFAGTATPAVSDIFCGRNVCGYLEREELSLLNAVPTAEGAVAIAIEELPVTLSGLKILIVGCGRIGTALIGILKGFGADISVGVRTPSAAAKARILGAKPCRMESCGTDFGLVINTAPTMIFTKELLEKFDKNTLFIDLASKPGGIDFDAAASLGIKAVWALGLPGKTAPITAGEIIADTIHGIISEKGAAYE